MNVQTPESSYPLPLLVSNLGALPLGAFSARLPKGVSGMRHGTRWSVADYKRLLRAMNSAETIADIAARCNRSIGSILCRLRAMGMASNVNRAAWDHSWRWLYTVNHTRLKALVMPYFCPEDKSYDGSIVNMLERRGWEKNKHGKFLIPERFAGKKIIEGYGTVLGECFLHNNPSKFELLEYNEITAK